MTKSQLRIGQDYNRPKGGIHLTTNSFTFTVSGRVQGVGFRAYTARLGQRLAITGWVQNQRDGTVIGGACGLPESLEQFFTELQIGSPASTVHRVTKAPCEKNWPDTFIIRY